MVEVLIATKQPSKYHAAARSCGIGASDAVRVGRQEQVAARLVRLLDRRVKKLSLVDRLRVA